MREGRRRCPDAKGIEPDILIIAIQVYSICEGAPSEGDSNQGMGRRTMNRLSAKVPRCEGD